MDVWGKHAASDTTARKVKNVTKVLVKMEPSSVSILNFVTIGNLFNFAEVLRRRAAQDDMLWDVPFRTSRKNGAVRLMRLFATSSGVPVATISPPSAPASGPISTM